MAGWGEILTEIGAISPVDFVRRKYLRLLHEKTGRNIVCYYSGWLAKQGALNTNISDQDMEGFMNAVKGLDRNLGLDLLLHTPGGDVTATEAIVKYLRQMFNTDIRVVVPQLAMSAGTMIACAGKEIIMGKQSSLGPIDPQFGNIAAFNIKREYELFEKDIVAHPEKATYWAIRLNGIPSGFILSCINAINLSSELVSAWLKTGMFAEDPSADAIIFRIMENLNENEESKTHGRHFDKEKCKAIGLKITDMEEDNDLQDAILSVHHAYALTLTNTPVVKIIENHIGAAVLRYV